MLVEPGLAVPGQAFGRQPVVELRDAEGAPVAQGGVNVSVVVAAGTGTLNGTLTAATDGEGRASFTDLAIAGAGSHTLRFTAPGLAPAVSQGFFVEPPAPAPAKTYLVWAPRVVSAAAGGPATLTAFIPGAPSAVRVALAGGGTTDLAHDGTYRWTATVQVAQLLSGYQTGDAHQFVGFLDVYDGATRTFRGNLFVNVLDATMPAVTVSALGPDAQASEYVVNLRFDSLYLGQPVPPDVARRFYQLQADAFDFLAVVEQVESFSNRFFVGAANDVSGLGLPLFDNRATYGSAARLQGIIHFPIAGLFDLAEKAAVHELGHRWMSFLDNPVVLAGVPHWPISDIAYGIMGFSIPPTQQGGEFPYALVAQSGGSYRLECVPRATEYNDLELYLMGLLPADSVGPHAVFSNQDQLGALACNGTLQGPVQTLTIADVIAANGARPPAARRDLTLATIVLSQGRLLTADEIAFFDYMAARGAARTELPYTAGFSRGVTKPFYLATGGRASLETRVQ
ncbi:MAG: hypothetical protein ACREKS_13785 [Candidatus Rokuibacteriota bacterium]